MGRAAATVTDTAVKDKSDLKEGVGAASVPKSTGDSSLDPNTNLNPDLDTTITTTTNKPNLTLASSDINPATTLTLPMPPSSLDASTPQGTSVHTLEDDKVQDRRLSSLTIGSTPSSNSNSNPNSNSRPTSQSILRPSITTTTPSGNVVSRHTHSHSFAYSQPTSQQHPQQQQQKRSFSATHSRHQSDTSTSAFMANHTLRFDAPASTSTSSHTTSSLPSISTISSHPHHSFSHPHHPHTPSSSTSNWNAHSNATAKELTNDLLSTMKQTLSTMGATFDVLGEQTVKVAVLPAVLDVFEKVCGLLSSLLILLYCTVLY